MSFGMIINHNLGSMNALSALNQNGDALQSALQKLSTGKKINSAADDAAGLAISQKMQSQINGLNQASQNSQNGISLLQTADGALNETQSMLQRMNTLAVQAANDTNTTSDRQAMQKEVDQLTQQIDTIANTTQFNTKDLLTGNLGLSTDAGSLISNLSSTAATQTGTFDFGTMSFTAAKSATSTLSVAAGDTSAASDGSLSLSFDGSTYSVGFKAGESYTDIASAINNTVPGLTADFGQTTANTFTITSDAANGAQTLTVNEATANTLSSTVSNTGNTAQTGADATLTAGTGTDSNSNTINASNLTIVGNNITVNSGAQEGLSFTLDGASGATVDLTGKTASIGNGLNLQIGANQGQTMTVNINSMDASNLGVMNIDVTTQQGAESAIKSIQDAIGTVSNQRAQLGAYENRLQHTMNNLQTSSNNLTTAQSGITDTNMAQEMASFTKDNVLQQAAVSMLAQANQQPQLVLKLLG